MQFVPPPPPAMYLLQNRQPTSIIWTGTATTTGGVATFNPTSDNTGSGAALFSAIYVAHPTAIMNTGLASSVPYASIKAISADRKTITVNVATGLIIGLLGGTTTQFVADGTVVQLTIMGAP